jgi:hypothetical protein
MIDLCEARAMANSRKVAVGDVWFVLLCDSEADSARLLNAVGMDVAGLRKRLAGCGIS